MENLLTKSFGKNLFLKLISLILAIGLWYYAVNELGKGTEEETLALQRILPSYGMVTKKLIIKTIIVGKPKKGNRVLDDKITIVPEYCLVVGPRKLLTNLKFIYTLPIDVSNLEKTMTRAAPLKPLASGVYVEETLVTVSIPIEKI